MRTQEKKKWHWAELSTSLKSPWRVPFNQKVLKIVMKTQMIREMEQSGINDSVDGPSVCSRGKANPKDLDTGVGETKQCHDGYQYFQVYGGFDE
ncbi:hypothetical protein ElyMa_006101700 [Elysia marginata]|uniref:Uncharacterized protein n=1 Tax=Elysia marginata TaxID=1093978 RepID=A0AAV4GT38_9GAST|nr:hypothetical protein ElyMa_006101700 [Elysia marginata]